MNQGSRRLLARSRARPGGLLDSAGYYALTALRELLGRAARSSLRDVIPSFTKTFRRCTRWFEG
jgi:hypothetical protein